MTIQERKHVSPAGFYHVWEVDKAYEIYDDYGWRVATFYGIGPNVLKLAAICADAMDQQPPRR